LHDWRCNYCRQIQQGSKSAITGVIMIKTARTGQGMLPSPPLIWVIITQCFIGAGLLAITAILDLTFPEQSFWWGVVSAVLHLSGTFALANFAEMLSRRILKQRVHDSKGRNVIRGIVMLALFITTFSTMTFLASQYATWWVS
tara:strand:- start:8060 stop:8488 length:429 start_codon:yes stop_codon:yes gene_type:complete